MLHLLFIQHICKLNFFFPGCVRAESDFSEEVADDADALVDEEEEEDEEVLVEEDQLQNSVCLIVTQESE